MLIRFTKMHGLGNDFVLLDFISQRMSIRPEQIRTLANRRLGIGFDQLLIIEPPTNSEADFTYRIFNADGSESQQCGNGARCCLRFVRDQGLTTKTHIKLATASGLLECQLENDGNIAVNMGKPILEPKQIPFIADTAQPLYPMTINLPVCSADAHAMTMTKEFYIASLSMGNPHAVLQVDDIAAAPVKQLGSAFEQHQRFPERTNVGFMQIVSTTEIHLRVFERGVGETSACGTGACAAVVAGRLQGLLSHTVNVNLPGGVLRVSWPGENQPVLMTGPACQVFEGRLHI